MCPNKHQLKNGGAILSLNTPSKIAKKAKKVYQTVP